MKTKDILFIFLSIVLIILFALEVAENIFSLSERSSGSLEEGITVRASESLDLRSRFASREPNEILIKLEETGLAPREAKYYKIIE